jgi:hypothetical protein
MKSRSSRFWSCFRSFSAVTSASRPIAFLEAGKQPVVLHGYSSCDCAVKRYPNAVLTSSTPPRFHRSGTIELASSVDLLERTAALIHSRRITLSRSAIGDCRQSGILLYGSVSR